jgi:hypothetical protein
MRATPRSYVKIFSKAKAMPLGKKQTIQKVLVGLSERSE